MNIDKKVDELLNTKKISKRGKRLKLTRRLRTLPIGVSILLIIALITGAVLISWYGIYNIGFEGDIDLEGQDPFIFVDGQGITGDTVTLPITTTTLSAGDVITESHTVQNANTVDRICTFNLDDVTFTEENDEYFGYSCQILDDLDNPITELEVGVGETKTFKIEHTLHELFMETVNPLAFSIDMAINFIDPYGQVGVWVYSADTTGSNKLFLDVLDTNDNIIEIWDVTDTTLEHGMDWLTNSETKYDIITDSIETNTYKDTHGTNIHCWTFNMPSVTEQEYLGLIAEDIDLEDMIIKTKPYFYLNSIDIQQGHVFNYYDSLNYYYSYMDLANDVVELHQVADGTDTQLDSYSVTIDTLTNYVFETRVDNTGSEIGVILDGTEVITYTIV